MEVIFFQRKDCSAHLFSSLCYMFLRVSTLVQLYELWFSSNGLISIAQVQVFKVFGVKVQVGH